MEQSITLRKVCSENARSSFLLITPMWEISLWMHFGEQQREHWCSTHTAVVAMTWDVMRDCPGVPTCTMVTDTTTLTLLRYGISSVLLLLQLFSARAAPLLEHLSQLLAGRMLPKWRSDCTFSPVLLLHVCISSFLFLFHFSLFFTASFSKARASLGFLNIRGKKVFNKEVLLWVSQHSHVLQCLGKSAVKELDSSLTTFP